MSTDWLPTAEELSVAASSLAQRFASGSTMWCSSPQWPAHGDHVAVEFVHPVIMGKRALPAVHLDRADIATTLRVLARPGDVLLVIGTADAPEIASLMRRAEAWGLMRIWIGIGPRPENGVAEHFVWLDDAQPALAARDGDLVLLYHLMWELTHVVFEHPGLLVVDEECTEEVCITCSDEARVAEVKSLLSDDFAEVICGGKTEQVQISLIDHVSPQDLVLVHAGVAIATLEDEKICDKVTA